MSSLLLKVRSREAKLIISHHFQTKAFSRLLGLTQSLVRRTVEECRTKTWKLDFNERSLENQAEVKKDVSFFSRWITSFPTLLCLLQTVTKLILKIFCCSSRFYIYVSFHSLNYYVNFH